MDPARLAVWTSIGINYATFQPRTEEILKRYLLKFSKGSKGQPSESSSSATAGPSAATADELGLADPSEETNGEYDDEKMEEVAELWRTPTISEHWEAVARARCEGGAGSTYS